MFRDDFEFHDEAGPSHLHGSARAHAGSAADAEPAAPADGAAAAPGRDAPAAEGGSMPPDAGPEAGPAVPVWAADATAELRKIPFFVRGKARRNTEAYAASRGLGTITLETLYDAKAHFSR